MEILHSKLRSLEIGETLEIPRPSQQTERAHKNQVSKDLRFFKQTHKDYHFKTRHEQFCSYVTRIVKNVGTQRWDLVYYLTPTRSQTIFKSMPYIIAKQKMADYKRNPNYKTGNLQLEKTIQ